MTYDFQERLEFSKGSRQTTDAATIMQLLDGCASVDSATTEMDKRGVDYIARLRGGANVFVDAKTRSKGCSKYWQGQPELAIEKWSVMPGGKFETRTGKAGWSLDEAKLCHMILYTFDPSDSELAFLIPFQSLRMAARRMINDWMGRFKVDVQTSGGWQSQAVFVPASEIIMAMEETYSAITKIS